MYGPTTRITDALENIASELEVLRVLKEYELGVYVEVAPGGTGHSVLKVGEEE
jgi:hypothetical protein